MKLMRMLSLAIFAIAANGTAHAAGTCYENKVVPAHYTCSSSDSNSADFTEGCRYEPDTVKEVEVECPKEAVWVPASATASAAATCNAKNMAVSSIDGAVCKSREQAGTYAALNNPNTLFNPWGVNCREWNCETIGNRVGMSAPFYTCWEQGDRQDFDPSDLVTHYACIAR
jgi:hypothetical protein